MPLPGLLQTFLCILNFLALAGKTVKNGMKAKTPQKKLKALFQCENHYIHTDNFSRLIELKIGLVEPNLIWFHKYDNIQSTAFH